VVGARSDKSVQFAEPGQNRSAVEEDIGDCAFAGIWAVSMRSVGVAVQSELLLSEVVGEANIHSSLEIAK
jgi:hypothetical protein